MKKNNNTKFLFNNDIKYNQVRLKDQEENIIGVVSFKEAEQMANNQKLDLVLLTDKAIPPVVALCEKTKFLYEYKKKQQQLKKKQSNMELQEIQLSLFIDQHDINHKIEKIKKIILKGNKIKLSIKLRRRYKNRGEDAKKIMEQTVEMLQGICQLEKEVVIDKHMVWCICLPDKKFICKS